MVENLSATTSFITFIKLLLRVRSIPWYIAQFCPLTVGQSPVPRMHGRQLITFLGSGKEIKPVTGCKTESKHNLSLFRLRFFLYRITVNPSEVQLEVAEKQEKKKLKLKFFCRSFLFLE